MASSQGSRRASRGADFYTVLPGFAQKRESDPRPRGAKANTSHHGKWSDRAQFDLTIWRSPGSGGSKFNFRHGWVSNCE